MTSEVMVMTLLLLLMLVVFSFCGWVQGGPTLRVTVAVWLILLSADVAFRDKLVTP